MDADKRRSDRVPPASSLRPPVCADTDAPNADWTATDRGGWGPAEKRPEKHPVLFVILVAVALFAAGMLLRLWPIVWGWIK